jgi:hypothetical protein
MRSQKNQLNRMSVVALWAKPVFAVVRIGNRHRPRKQERT